MEEDVIIIDADGGQRNAVIVRRPSGNPPIVGGGGRFWNQANGGHWTRPQAQAYQSQAYPAPVPQIIQVPAQVPAKSSAKNWIPDLIDILAALTPLPAPPAATGDIAKDFSNAMQYAGALAASLKRADLLHTAARIAEKRL